MSSTGFGYISPTLFDGYFANEQTTKDAWRNEYMHTGDLGRVDEEGFLYVVDRLKDMILSGGLNIYPKDIEDVIYTIPGVNDVAVIGIPDTKWGEAIHAIVVHGDSSKLSEDQIISVCTEKLARFQVPRAVEFRESLPRNPSGKILKRELRKEFWPQEDSSTAE
jgi:acyl-CoA synthetase (AMP-forming)/AMP-acid ligase II